jgi:cytochrome c-type biogenesis protein CcmH/NrfG
MVDAVVSSLQRAAQSQPKSADILVDLASALAERGATQGRSADYESAETILNRVLFRDPGNLTALFNRALVRRIRGNFQRAAEEWLQYLRMEPSGAWAAEAKEQLDRIRAH